MERTGVLDRYWNTKSLNSTQNLSWAQRMHHFDGSSDCLIQVLFFFSYKSIFKNICASEGLFP